MKNLQITPIGIDRSEKSIDIYFNSIAKQQPISPEEEKKLAVRIHEGDKKALDRLVCGNLRFVIHEAKKYQNAGIPLADLIEEGNLGLVKAAQKFDETKGCKFSTYAVWWIKEAIITAIRNNGHTIRHSKSQCNLEKEIKNAQKQFEFETGSPATVEDIAEMLDIEPQKVKEILYTNLHQCSLDDYLYDDEKASLGSTVAQDLYEAPDFDSDRLDTSDIISLALKGTLNERDIEIVRKRFGLDGEVMSVQQLADENHLTGTRIRQIVDEAMETIRHSRYSQELRMCC